MDLYKLLCKECKRKADEWSEDMTIDHSDENWEAKYKPCDDCQEKINKALQEK